MPDTPTTPGLHVSPICGDCTFAELEALRPDCAIIKLVWKGPAGEALPHGFSALLSIPRSQIDAARGSGTLPLISVEHGSVTRLITLGPAASDPPR